MSTPDEVTATISSHSARLDELERAVEELAQAVLNLDARLPPKDTKFVDTRDALLRALASYIKDPTGFHFELLEEAWIADGRPGQREKT